MAKRLITLIGLYAVANAVSHSDQNAWDEFKVRKVTIAPKSVRFI